MSITHWEYILESCDGKVNNEANIQMIRKSYDILENVIKNPQRQRELFTSSVFLSLFSVVREHKQERSRAYHLVMDIMKRRCEAT